MIELKLKMALSKDLQRASVAERIARRDSPTLAAIRNQQLRRGSRELGWSVLQL
jgi:hypothetical protein